MDRKQEIRAALDGHHPVLGRSIALLLQALIIISMISIGVETLPDLPVEIRIWFAVEEAVIVAVFTVEYLLRIYAAERRLAYLTSFWGIIDLLAILPFYLALGLDLRAARALRLLRMLRILKLMRCHAASERIGRALRGCIEELVVFGIAALILLYCCSIMIYYFEHDAQPHLFASVFQSMWWAAITLTTVGYGDVYPVTPGGRAFTIVMLIIALGVIAVPTGIITSALSELRKHDKQGT